MPFHPFVSRLVLACCVPALSACSLLRPDKPFRAPESFDSTTTYSRSYGAQAERACESARRALLSQGYAIVKQSADSVSGRKNFQPTVEVNAQVEINAVCTRDGPNASLVFVNAVQDRYALKKSANSASVGVGAIGSLSLPFTSGDDAMVKVGSETVQDGDFYERFFVLLERYLPDPWIESAPAADPSKAERKAPSRDSGEKLDPPAAKAAPQAEPAGRSPEGAAGTGTGTDSGKTN